MLLVQRSVSEHVTFDVGELVAGYWIIEVKSLEEALVAPVALLRGREGLARKYVCGVVPSIVRNISMKALTLS